MFRMTAKNTDLSKSRLLSNLGYYIILIINTSKLLFLCRWLRITRSHFPSAFHCLHVYEEEFEDRGNTNESINRRTDNTMAKRNMANNDLKNIHIKQKIE